MLDRIFRVKAGGAALKPQPGQGCSDLVLLPEGQAVARLDYTLYDGWYLVFVDTPGEGLYLGYIHEVSVQPIEAMSLTGAAAATTSTNTAAQPAPPLGTQPTAPQGEGSAERPPTLSETVGEAPQPAPSTTDTATPGPATSVSPTPTPLPPLFPTPPASVLPPGKLSAHFTLAEFIRSNTATVQQIDNTPPPDIIERLKVTAGRMEQVRALLGGNSIHITSGYRNPTLNEAVGGTATSDHMSGYAVDFVCPNFGTPYQICCAIRDSDLMAHVDQLIHEKLRWVHISFDPQCRGELLSFFDRPNKKTVRLPNILPQDPG